MIKGHRHGSHRRDFEWLSSGVTLTKGDLVTDADRPRSSSFSLEGYFPPWCFGEGTQVEGPAAIFGDRSVDGTLISIGSPILRCLGCSQDDVV